MIPLGAPVVPGGVPQIGKIVGGDVDIRFPF